MPRSNPSFRVSLEMKLLALFLSAMLVGYEAGMMYADYEERVYNAARVNRIKSGTRTVRISFRKRKAA